MLWAWRVKIYLAHSLQIGCLVHPICSKAQLIKFILPTVMCMTKAYGLLSNICELGILNCTCPALCTSSISDMWWTRIHLEHITTIPWAIILQIRLQLIETLMYLNFVSQHTIPRCKSTTYYGICVRVQMLRYLGSERGNHLYAPSKELSMVRVVIASHQLLILKESVSVKSINSKIHSTY